MCIIFFICWISKIRKRLRVFVCFSSSALLPRSLPHVRRLSVRHESDTTWFDFPGLIRRPQLCNAVRGGRGVMLHPVCLCLPAACTHMGSPAMFKLFYPILLLPVWKANTKLKNIFLSHTRKKINSMSNVGLFGKLKLTISVDLIVRPSWINLFLTGSNLTTAVRQCCYIYMWSKMMT